jgi:hypothetical protein
MRLSACECPLMTQSGRILSSQTLKPNRSLPIWVVGVAPGTSHIQDRPEVTHEQVNLVDRPVIRPG